MYMLWTISGLVKRLDKTSHILRQVLPDVYVKEWIPGETVSEEDIRKWAEWENSFFRRGESS